MGSPVVRKAYTPEASKTIKRPKSANEIKVKKINRRSLFKLDASIIIELFYHKNL